MTDEHIEPNFDVAQLAHVEMYTPKIDDSLRFFTDLIGLQETGRDGSSVYLRAYEDFYHHTLKLTEAPEAGLGHVAWRTSSPQALARRVEAIEQSGLGKGWIDGDQGHGAAYQFQTPDGHPMEILWDVEYHACPAEEHSRLGNRPSRRPLAGVPVRRLDHINVLASDVDKTREFLMDQLGFRLRECVVEEDDSAAACWLSVSPLVHEIAVMRDAHAARGRLHHVCYWYGIPQHLNDIADIIAEFTEYGVTIEAGPAKHGVSQALFMYVFEPGGNRVELFGDAGYLIFDPAWEPVVWKGDDVAQGIVWYGGELPAEYFRYATPAVEPQEAQESAAPA